LSASRSLNTFEEMETLVLKRRMPVIACCAIFACAACSAPGARNSARQAQTNLCSPSRDDAWLSDPALCLVEYSSNVGFPRGMAFAPNGDLFVSAGDVVIVLYDDNRDGISDPSERARFGSISGLSHGIAFSPDGQYLYASSATDVYRWPYATGDRTARGPAARVVSGMSPEGHTTRTLVLDSIGRLYVSIGSRGNLDVEPELRATRSQIRRFVLSSVLPAGGIDFQSGEVIGSGTRNEVGMTFDSLGRMWGVENGRDELIDNRFGGDIHYDNPGEKLNRIDGPGPTYFGYPQCWAEGDLPGGSGPGTEHADQQMPPDLLQSDDWCQNSANVRPPAAVMPAHWAPLGIVQYTGELLPGSYRGDLFITSHGSWNREIGQVGRLVARARLSPNGVVQSIEPIVGEKGGNGQLRQGYWRVRPVDIQQGPDGALYFSDDLGASVFRIAARSSGALPDGGAPASDAGQLSSANAKSGCSAAPAAADLGALLGLLSLRCLKSKTRRTPPA
jgi:glucose/arabinose dehydrogenase